MFASEGTLLGSYRLLERVGRGGMGEVYRAQHLRLGSEAAVKILRPSLLREPDALARFAREAASAAALQHPNILAVWDYGEQEGIPYLVMPYIRGGTLKERLRHGPLAPHETVRYLVQMAEALDYAHARGLIHRDVNPANMLLDERGRLYLADFGIARALEATVRLTRAGVGIGTPEYMAPEQAEGRADERSDLYALGIILYQMLTGQVPYRGQSGVEVLLKHVLEPVPLLPLQRVDPPLPPAVAAVVQRALAKDPDARYQSGRTLAGVVQAALLRRSASVAAWDGTPLGDAVTLGSPASGPGWHTAGAAGAPPAGQQPVPASGTAWPLHGVPPMIPPPPGAAASGGGVRRLLLGALLGGLLLVLVLLGGAAGAFVLTRPDTRATATAAAGATGTAQAAVAATRTAADQGATTATAGAIAVLTARAPTATPPPPVTARPTATPVPTATTRPTATSPPSTPSPTPAFTASVSVSPSAGPPGTAFVFRGRNFRAGETVTYEVTAPTGAKTSNTIQLGPNEDGFDFTLRSLSDSTPGIYAVTFYRQDGTPAGTPTFTITP